MCSSRTPVITSSNPVQVKRRSTLCIVPAGSEAPQSVSSLSEAELCEAVIIRDTLRSPALNMGTSTPVCQSTGTDPDLHASLEKNVNQDNQTMTRAFSISVYGTVSIFTVTVAVRFYST